MIEYLTHLPRKTQLLLAILVLSVSFRILAAFYFGDQVDILPGTYDQISYHNLALRVLDGHGFSFGEPWWPLTAANAPTAHWSFLYTLYLVVTYALFGPHPLAARLIQAFIVGLLQPFLTYLIARRLFGEIFGLTAAFLTAIYIYFIYYNATLMTESFYITAILGALYFSIRMVDHLKDRESGFPLRRSLVLAIGLGLTLGIAILLRQLFLLIVPFIFLWIWWSSRNRGARSPIPWLILSSVLIAALILPFTIYNYARFGRFVLLNTNAGYAFFWSNHPIYGTHFVGILPPQIATYQSLIPQELRHLDEAALDQALLKRGIQFVLDDPVRYFLLSLSRIPEYFMFWPSTQSSTISNISRIASFGLLWPFMLYGILISLLRGRRGMRGRSIARPTQLFDPSSPTTMQATSDLNPGPRAPNPRASMPLYPKFSLSSPIFLLLIFSLIYTGIHLLSWALIRYRLPVDAVLLIFAAFALVDLAQRLGVISRRIAWRFN